MLLNNIFWSDSDSDHMAVPLCAAVCEPKEAFSEGPCSKAWYTGRQHAAAHVRLHDTHHCQLEHTDAAHEADPVASADKQANLAYCCIAHATNACLVVRCTCMP